MHIIWFNRYCALICWMKTVSYLKTMSQKQLNYICTNFFNYALSANVVRKACQNTIKCCIYSRTIWSASVSSRLQFCRKQTSTDYQKLLGLPMESPFQDGEIYCKRKYDNIQTIKVVDYLSYVFPKILHNYFQLPFRLAEDLHPFSWKAEETISNKIASSIYDSMSLNSGHSTNAYVVNNGL